MTIAADTAAVAFWPRFVAWAKRHKVTRKLVAVLAVLSMASVIATYGALTRTDFGPAPRDIVALLLLDLVLLMALGALVARKLVQLWAEHRQGVAGAKLHVRLVGLFSVVAFLPTIVVGVFSALFFDLGLQGWFSEKVRSALGDSLAVAEAYVDEHRKVIVGDVLAMANDINREAVDLGADPAAFNDFVGKQAAIRVLQEAIVLSGSNDVLARAPLSFALEFERVPAWALQRAAMDEVAVLANQSENRVRAVVRLRAFPDAYLLVGRFVESRVLGHVERARRAVSSYADLEGARSSIQITFALVFIVIALLLLLVATLVAMQVASRLVVPIGALVKAAERARDGDLSVRVAESTEDDEVATLTRVFNGMTGQLESQRAELIDANRLADERRRFTEAVLAGVSAGVLGLDPTGRIELPNRSAVLLLETEAERLIGRRLEDAVPELQRFLDEAKAKIDRGAQGQVEIQRHGRRRNLLVRVGAEKDGDRLSGYVVTFDDITDLVAAQRTAAWADVARRIAHEIKNPLTPIQLSAERLKRKYLNEITTEPEVFRRCTDTIIRQVVDIGRMVDEFSSFARMPAPVFADEDIGELARHALFLQQIAHPELVYDSVLPPGPLPLRCDGRQVSQAITNILKNAAEAIEARRAAEGQDGRPGRIELRVGLAADGAYVEVIDNGRGVPEEIKGRLTEPYVTTRAKGTGLGLAIVKKIMEDHGGTLTVENRPQGGALARLGLPSRTAETRPDTPKVANAT
jgi:two-component system nitrogen regulation sensor histidine kinase NtrY